jgi:hypothetical protein
MTECTCRTDPLFYYVFYDDPPDEMEIDRMCVRCCGVYYPGRTLDQVRDYFDGEGTIVFDTVEAAQLYIIKRRL